MPANKYNSDQSRDQLEDVHLMQDNLFTECAVFVTSQNYSTDCPLCATCPECLAWAPTPYSGDVIAAHTEQEHERTGHAVTRRGRVWEVAPVAMKVAILLSITLVLAMLWGVVWAALQILELI